MVGGRLASSACVPAGQAGAGDRAGGSRAVLASVIRSHRNVMHLIHWSCCRLVSGVGCAAQAARSVVTSALATLCACLSRLSVRLSVHPLRAAAPSSLVLAGMRLCPRSGAGSRAPSEGQRCHSALSSHGGETRGALSLPCCSSGPCPTWLSAAVPIHDKGQRCRVRSPSAGGCPWHTAGQVSTALRASHLHPQHRHRPPCPISARFARHGSPPCCHPTLLPAVTIPGDTR